MLVSGWQEEIAEAKANFFGEAADLVERGFADTFGRDLEKAVECVRFLGVSKNSKVSDRGLDLGALEELFFFDADVRDAGTLEGFGDVAGGEVGADQDGVVSPVLFVAVMSGEDFCGDPIVFFSSSDEWFDEHGRSFAGNFGDDAFGES